MATEVAKSMEEEIEDLKKQVLLLNVGMAVVMRILKQKGLVSVEQVIGDVEKLVADAKESKEETPDKEAGYNQILRDFEPKIKN